MTRWLLPRCCALLGPRCCTSPPLQSLMHTMHRAALLLHTTLQSAGVTTVRLNLQRLGSGSRVVGLDKDAKTASLSDGSVLQYEALLSTMPLDLTLQTLGKPDWASELTHRWTPHADCCTLRQCWLAGGQSYCGHMT